MPMSEVLSLIYEATRSWNARVVLGFKQGLKTYLFSHSVPTCQVGPR